ncbi:DUF1768-domain-containing protein [Boletus reticuloceps]|uniref:DUF1768-domain-containing protein n=1 Tax=Boletus reticuloceps TaxID=495285 RepID=A0A8I3A396_9AGAM|nr:DUF1768-domain-containing protein [Boletus reticuloceps]
MGLVQSLLTACTRCWDAGDTHIVISPSGGWAHAHARPKILFYDKHKPYYEFTNFSPHEVVYEGRCYPTSEHLFQAFKFLDGHPQIAERIRTCGPKPIRAFDEAHRHKTAVRSDWSQVHISKMETALNLKFTQHQDLKQMLLDTGDAELLEDSPRDWFWGIGADGTGNNELGKMLMRLRDELRNEVNGVTPAPPPAPASKSTSKTTSNHRSQGRAGTSKRQAPRIHVSGNGGSTHGVCGFCRAKPTYPRSRYCSRACADHAATMCKYCQTNPRARGQGAYCSRTCADKAHGK